ncbi:MAG: DUF4280 domain-containing protein [Eubacterium sp.]|nr:DUF4280 domain-containing protein [Eubacterium sp.]
MGMCVCGGAMLQCTFGAAPMPLTVLPDKKVVNNMPIATIDCNKPGINIPPFGVCAATGVGAPCSMAFTAPWVPGSPTVLVGGQPALNQNSKLICALGGVVSVIMPGCTNIEVP